MIPADTEVVDLSDCPSITVIPNHLFDKLPNLKGIIIRKTNITRITRTIFTGLSSVEFIDLTGSHIMTIEPGAFKDLTKLTKLYFGGIPLDSIPPDVINGLPNLTSWVRPDGTEVRLRDTRSRGLTTVTGSLFAVRYDQSAMAFFTNGVVHI